MLFTGGGNPGCGARVRSSMWAPCVWGALNTATLDWVTDWATSWFTEKWCPEPLSWDKTQCEAPTHLGRTLDGNRPQKRHCGWPSPGGKSPCSENVSYYYYYLIRSDKITVKGGATAACNRHGLSGGSWLLRWFFLTRKLDHGTNVKHVWNIPFSCTSSERASQTCSPMNVLLSNGNPQVGIILLSCTSHRHLSFDVTLKKLLEPLRAVRNHQHKAPRGESDTWLLSRTWGFKNCTECH